MNWSWRATDLFAIRPVEVGTLIPNLPLSAQGLGQGGYVEIAFL